MRADQAEYEELNKDLDLQRHLIKANGVWDLPDLSTSAAAPARRSSATSSMTGSSRASSPATPATGTTSSYSYQNNGANVNLTGSPDYGARIVYLGDPGAGCSDNQYAQFNVAAVTGPSYSSLGLESGRNILCGCADKTVDLSIARNIRLGGSRQLQFRLDVFNAFNVGDHQRRQTQIQFNNPVDKTIRNAQFNADGSLNPARLTPRNAGFGAATGAQTMRNLQVRFASSSRTRIYG